MCENLRNEGDMSKQDMKATEGRLINNGVKTVPIDVTI